jgi:hypothetical protein
MKTLFLIAEYCPGPFYMGWHLYLREHVDKRTRNADGEWGWLRYSPNDEWRDKQQGRQPSAFHPARKVMNQLGFPGRISGGDGDDGEIAKFAFKHRLPRQRVGGKPRGCVRVVKDEYGKLSLAEERQ